MPQIKEKIHKSIFADQKIKMIELAETAGTSTERTHNILQKYLCMTKAVCLADTTFAHT